MYAGYNGSPLACVQRGRVLVPAVDYRTRRHQNLQVSRYWNKNNTCKRTSLFSDSIYMAKTDDHNLIKEIGKKQNIN